MTTQQILTAARDARRAVGVSGTEQRNRALLGMAAALEDAASRAAILEANAADLDAARGHISEVMLDRLALNDKRLDGMAQGIREVAALPDPVGAVLRRIERPNGLVIEKTAVPMGVIAIIYESRPNVTSDAAALALKSGSACVLRCGKEAWRSSKAIVDALRQGVTAAGLPADAVSLIEDTTRASSYALMEAVGYVDLLIPRGGAGLIRACVENAKVPCIQTGTGICHIYVDDTADQDKALDIIENADGYTYVIDGEEGVIHTGMNEAEFTATRTVPVADPSVTGVSRWLNTTDHIAYLTGYPGGAFGPDNNMTRAEVAQMFYALLNNKNVTITKTFPDVPADAWYATAVNTLASLGMVSGDENGNYRPNDPITRAEFCVIALAFAYEPENAVCYFGDVSRSDWFYTYVAQAASYGWIGGYTNGNFGPNDRITRAQVTTIVNNMLGRAADRDYVIDHQADLVQFTDLTRAHWGYFQIMEATNAHDYTKSNGTENWR